MSSSKRCGVCKTEVEGLLQHSRSQWHLYNLKRQVLELGPVSLTVYDEKVKKDNENVNTIFKTKYCCNKEFQSKGSYISHLNSKKHKLNQHEPEVESEEDSDNSEGEKLDEEEARRLEEEGMIVEYEEEDGEDDAEQESVVLKALTVKDCLFCEDHFKNIDNNLKHMAKQHGFKFPLEEFVSDKEGLLKYCVELIDEHNVCLNCDKQFFSRFSVRNHMRDRQHNTLYFDIPNNGFDLKPYYEETPKIAEVKEVDSIQVELPSGKKVVSRMVSSILNQKLNTFSATKRLAIVGAEEKANKELVKVTTRGNGQLIVSSGQQLTKTMKTIQDKAAKNHQMRQSRFNNIQHFYRCQTPLY